MQIAGRGGVPGVGVAAVVLAAVVPQPASSGDLQISPSGARPSQRTSNLNWAPGTTVAGLVTVQVGTDGAVVLSVSQAQAHVALDVVGWYGDGRDTGGSRFTSLTPARVLDTRPAAVRAGADLRLPLRGRGGVPERADVRAVVLNLTALGADGPADVQLYPTGASPQQRTSNLNLVRGQTVAVAVNATLGADGSIRMSVSRGRVQLVVDVLGYYSDQGDRFVPVQPMRVSDGTSVGTSDTDVRLAGRGTVAADASAILLNVTGTAASQVLDLAAYPAGARPRPRTSLLNLRPGQAVPNAAAARLADGSLGLSASQGRVRVLLDVFGYFTPR